MASRVFFDEFQSYFYLGGLALSTLGSLAAVVVGRLNRRKSQDELSRIDRLIGIADQAIRARDLSEIEALEQELNEIVGWFVKSGAGGDASASRRHRTRALRHRQAARSDFAGKRKGRGAGSGRACAETPAGAAGARDFTWSGARANRCLAERRQSSTRALGLD